MGAAVAGHPRVSIGGAFGQRADSLPDPVELSQAGHADACVDRRQTVVDGRDHERVSVADECQQGRHRSLDICASPDPNESCRSERQILTGTELVGRTAEILETGDDETPLGCEPKFRQGRGEGLSDSPSGAQKTVPERCLAASQRQEMRRKLTDGPRNAVVSSTAQQRKTLQTHLGPAGWFMKDWNLLVAAPAAALEAGPDILRGFKRVRCDPAIWERKTTPTTSMCSHKSCPRVISPRAPKLGARGTPARVCALSATKRFVCSLHGHHI